MIKILKKILVIMGISLITIFGLVSCSNKLENNEDVILNDSLYKHENDNVLAIKELDLEELGNKKLDKSTMVIKTIKNTSNDNISDIWINYNELDSQGNIVGESKMFLDMSLKPEEIFKASFKLKEVNGNIDITGYIYSEEDKNIEISLKENNIKIIKISNIIEDSSLYESILIQDIIKTNVSESGDSYNIIIENNGSKNLGNLILKIAEIDRHGNYIKINYEASNSVLEPEQIQEIPFKVSNRTKDIRVVGYTYNDASLKANIDINLDSKKAKVNME